MDWTIPSYNRLPDPLIEFSVDDFSLPVIDLPAEIFLSPPLHDKHIRIYALLGFMAPPGNIKRIPAGYTIDRLIERGELKPGDGVCDSTSGNWGVSIAYCAKRYDLRAFFIVSNKVPDAKLLPIKRQGATILKESEATKELGLDESPGCMELARLYAEKFNLFYFNQYGNPLNPESYRVLVAPHLWQGIDGQAKLYVSAIGTRGTQTGLGGYFKEQDKDFQIVSTFPYLGQEIDGTRDERRLKEVTQPDIADYRDPIDHRVARAVSAFLNENGIPAGPSSGAALGSLDHYLLNRVVAGTLDELRSENGSIGTILTFADTLYPYS